VRPMQSPTEPRPARFPLATTSHRRRWRRKSPAVLAAAARGRSHVEIDQLRSPSPRQMRIRTSPWSGVGARRQPRSCWPCHGRWSVLTLPRRP